MSDKEHDAPWCVDLPDAEIYDKGHQIVIGTKGTFSLRWRGIDGEFVVLGDVTESCRFEVGELPTEEGVPPRKYWIGPKFITKKA